MAKIILAKNKTVLRPVGDEAWSAICRLSEGQQVVAEIKAARNIRALRMAWALAGAVQENAEFFPSKETAMEAIKIGTGHCETWFDPATGEARQRAMSIDFERMEEIDFADFLDRAITLITVRWFSNGVTGAELLRRCNQIIDGSAARRSR